MIGIFVRLALAASLAISAGAHAYLYVHGYQHIPTIGAGFLMQATVSPALALLIAAGGPGWLRWAGGAMAAGSLVAFALSRTVGLYGFAETGWEPSPYAAISTVAELFTLALWWTDRRLRLRRRPTTSLSAGA